MRKLLERYRSILLYIFFGGLTTLVNIVAYYLLSRMGMATVPATGVAWVLSVAFAYVTNRRWVFDSKASSPREIVREAFSFAVCRLLSGLMDVAIMYVCVDLLHWNDLLIKIISNVLVVIANYVASKLFVFRSR